MGCVRAHITFLVYGVMSYITDEHYFTLNACSEQGKNNSTELSVLKHLLRRDSQLGLKTLQVFGNSLLVVNLMNGKKVI
jgi:hypothetical protein